MTTPISLEHDGPVAIAYLDAPPANPLGPEAIVALHAAIDEVERADARVLLFLSRADMFAAGADLKAVDTMLAGSDLSAFEAYVERFERALARLERLPLPVIACLSGHALGGGLELALACDLRLAADDPALKLGLPEVRLGVIPAAGGTQRIARLIGRSRALELLLTGRSLSPSEALSCGLVHSLHAPERIREVALTLARRLAAGSRAAQAALKRLVIEGLDSDLSTGLALERSAILELIRGADAREGIRAFVEKRPASFA